MSATVQDQVRTVVIDLFLGGDQQIPLDAATNLVQSGICDSLGLVRLAATLETVFPGLRIQDQDITHEKLGSVQAISSLIERSGAAS